VSRPWPWPKETALGRARRVAVSYRSALEQANSAACALLDAEMLVYGQRWVVPVVVPYTADDLLTADQVADYAGCAVKTVYEWRRDRGLVSITTPDGIRFRFDVVQKWCGNERHL
jgi:hypothetical protein